MRQLEKKNQQKKAFLFITLFMALFLSYDQPAHAAGDKQVIKTKNIEYASVKTESSKEDGAYVYRQFFKEERLLDSRKTRTAEELFLGEWEIKEAYLTLYYTVSPLLLTEQSDYTVFVNDSPVYSGRPDRNSDAVQGIRITLQGSLLKPGSNRIEIQSCLKIRDKQDGNEESTGAAWLIVKEESAITITYESRNKTDSIAAFYRAFLSQEALLNKESRLLLPSDFGDQELTMAANALLFLASNAGAHYNFMELEQYGEEDKNKAVLYEILVSRLEKLPEEVAVQMSEEQKLKAENGCLMTLLLTKQGEKILLITGTDPLALDHGIRVLGNAAYMKQLTGKEKTFDTYAEGLTEQPEKQNAAANSTEQRKKIWIPLPAQYLHGPFRQTASYFIKEGSGKKMGAGTILRLSMRCSENLDFDRSLVTVYLDGMPIGSKKLTESSAKGEEWCLEVPEDAAAIGGFFVEVAFDLELKNPEKAVLSEDMPWVMIGKESGIELVCDDLSGFLFEYLPYPFVQDSKIDPTQIVLTGEPGESQLAVMKAVLLTFGSFVSDNRGILKVSSGGYQKEFEDFHLIIIGKAETNFFVDHFNEQLSFQFSPKRTTILPNNIKKVEPNYGASLATVQLFDSPYKPKDRAVFLVSSVNDQKLSAAAMPFQSADQMSRLSGDSMLADEKEILCFQIRTQDIRGEHGENDEENREGNTEGNTEENLRTEQRERVLLFLLTGISAALFVSVLLFRRFREKGESKDSN